MTIQWWYGPVIALQEIQSYLGAAKRQQRRIERIRASTYNAIREGRSRRGEGLFADVHFYLICWARIAKLGRFIWRVATNERFKLRFKRSDLVLRQYRSDLDVRISARNHLEHLEARLPGGSEQEILAVPNDLLNMTNEFLTYGGCKLDIGRNSIRLLKEIVCKLQLAVLCDSLEVLETTDQRRLDMLLRKAGREVSARCATAKAKRMLHSRLPTSLKL